MGCGSHRCSPARRDDRRCRCSPTAGGRVRLVQQGMRIMPEITKDEAVVTVINAFNVDPENQQRLIDLLATATEETISKMPGFLSASFHKSVDGTRVVNYAQWATQRAWEAIFTDPAAKAHIE